MSLPIFQSEHPVMMLMQTQWASQLDKLLSNPIVGGNLITNIDMIAGTNVINHRLGKKLQGWIVVGQNADANFYDRQSTNSMPNLTLQLVSSAIVTINLYVF